MNIEVTQTQEPSSARKRVTAVAHGMLSGEVSFLAGATELAQLGQQIRTQDNDPDFRVFEVIASTSGHNKLGITKVPPLDDDSFVWDKKIGITACQSLLKRFHD
jgi:hypothetical protein